MTTQENKELRNGEKVWCVYLRMGEDEEQLDGVIEETVCEHATGRNWRRHGSVPVSCHIDGREVAAL